MGSFEDTSAKQRLVELDIDEVSVVDLAANETTFYVIKNMNNEEVGTMADTQKVESPDTQKPAVVEIDTANVTDQAVAKAMDQVTALIGNIANSVGAKAETPPAAAPTPVEKNLETAPTAPITEKPAAEVEAVVEKTFEETLKALSSVIEKAKRFTPKREAVMKDALEKLSMLAKEMGGEENETNAPQTAPSGVSYGATEITKALDSITAQLKTALDPIVAVTKTLGERIENIEKTRMPSNSIEQDDTSVETNVEKGFWSGIL